MTQEHVEKPGKKVAGETTQSLCRESGGQLRGGSGWHETASVSQGGGMLQISGTAVASCKPEMTTAKNPGGFSDLRMPLEELFECWLEKVDVQGERGKVVVVERH